MDLSKYVKGHLEDGVSVRKQVAKTCSDSISEAISLIAESFTNGRKLLLCGNGGSAADCQHMAAEFVSSFSKDVSRDSLPAIALTTNTSTLTAYANDFGYDGVFSRQIQGLGAEGDVLLGISTSGNSKNVILAVHAASGLGIKTIVLTGAGGGALKSMADICIEVPSAETTHIQECHLAIEHIICAAVEKIMFKRGLE